MGEPILDDEVISFGICKGCEVEMELWNHGADDLCTSCLEESVCLNCGELECECD